MGISLNICQNQPVRSTLSHQGLEPEVTWAWQQLSPTDKSARTREFELQRYEADNTTRLPDQVKKAVLMNETRGPLQQHLHLNAGTAPTYAAMSYYLQSTPSAASKQQPQQRQTGIVSSRRQYTGNYWRSDGNIAHVIPPKSTTTGPNNSKIADDIAEGSWAKQQKTAVQRPEATQEPDKPRLRVSAVTVTTKRGDKVKAVSNEDQREAETEKILLESRGSPTQTVWTKNKQQKEWNKRSDPWKHNKSTRKYPTTHWQQNSATRSSNPDGSFDRRAT